MSHEVDVPTYEIVGALERFDERDNVFARERLVPGSPEELAYHAQHPELVEIDRHLASFILRVSGQDEKEKDPLAISLYAATFGTLAPLAQPDVVDGPVYHHPVAAEPRVMARHVKALARRLGADQVRIGPLNPAWVYSHRGCPPFFTDYPPNPPLFSGVPEGYTGLRWGDPIEVPHRYAISMAFGQELTLISAGPSPASDFELGRVYARSTLAAVQLAAYIRGLGYAARAHHLRHYDVLVVPVAIDAGLGELGRCGYVINKGLGANFRLSCVTTNLPLLLDRPVDLGVQDFCQKCKKCAENCPTQAIPHGDKVVVRGVRKWQIQAEKCLLYWGHCGSACTICQSVCPWSKRRTLFHRAVAEVAVRVPAIRRALVWADDLVYGARFKPADAPWWARGEDL